MSYYALLIGVPRTGRTNVEMRAAATVIRNMQNFLLCANVPQCNIKLLDEPTCKEVEDAFKPIAKKVTEDDTLLIMFAGHGIQGQGSNPDGWALKGKDEITDVMLAQWLAKVPSAARRIVISDCCYGLAIARPGPEAKGFHRLLMKMCSAITGSIQGLLVGYRGRARRFARRMTSIKHGTEPLAPMICLAAASAIDLVTNKDERLFIRLTLGAAAGGCNYEDLEKDFDTVRTSTSNFCIETNPKARRNEIVLAALQPPGGTDRGDEQRAFDPQLGVGHVLHAEPSWPL